jgi:hypothetical protein
MDGLRRDDSLTALWTLHTCRPHRAGHGQPCMLAAFSCSAGWNGMLTIPPPHALPCRTDAGALYRHIHSTNHVGSVECISTLFNADISPADLPRANLAVSKECPFGTQVGRPPSTPLSYSLHVPQSNPSPRATDQQLGKTASQLLHHAAGRRSHTNVPSASLLTE